NHIEHYGTDPHMEEMTIHTKEPLIMFNIQAVAGSTCLIWEHIEDSPGKRCSNPRVIMPRQLVPDRVDGAVRVMLRSFGVRTPPCTRDNPSFGMMGFLHLLPASLAWLWRLVAPRGHANPSVTGSDDMASEGVGSYWPFATGRVVDHANLLLRQIQTTPKVRYVLIPNQHVGAWAVSFMPQWISREYLARRGVAGFHANQVMPARSNLLGYTPKTMQIDGATLPQWLLQVEAQSEVGTDGYDAGAAQLRGFFEKTLKNFLHPDLDPLGKQIITCCLDNGSNAEYDQLLFPAIEPDVTASLQNLW
ncbi:MAG: DUF4914 family protein, partial [Phycisphaerae bacterium]|nr:DUF4914 family protein [Phycisphaerae bacterium]